MALQRSWKSFTLVLCIVGDIRVLQCQHQQFFDLSQMEMAVSWQWFYSGEFFVEGFHQLVWQWDACLNAHGDCLQQPLHFWPEQSPNHFHLNKPYNSICIPSLQPVVIKRILMFSYQLLVGLLRGHGPRYFYKKIVYAFFLCINCI